jgi:hypothetical protein
MMFGLVTDLSSVLPIVGKNNPMNPMVNTLRNRLRLFVCSVITFLILLIESY